MLDACAALLKALLYAGLLTCAGLVWASRTLQLPASVEGFLWRGLKWSAGVVIIACVGGAAVLHQRLGGGSDEAIVAAVFSSTNGAAMFMQIVGAILVLALGNDPSARGTRLASAVVLTLSFALSGHSAAVGPFQGLIAALHATAAAWWIGSLLLLHHACGIGRGDLGGLLRRFSALATRIVGALAASGVLLIAILTDFATLPALSDYERNLVVKLLVVALVLALATYNKFSLTPRIERNDLAATASLRRSIAAELAVLIGVLGATAVLTTYTSPHA